jgi:cellulose synthase/poly-beta-1,6-N-acetylglucosamine synthase-like glycosyltransferase
MLIIHILFFAIQIIVGFHLIFPVILRILGAFKTKPITLQERRNESDYAIIVTAFEQTSLIPAVVNSILKCNYNNYLIYVVADKCDISTLSFESEKVILLRPEKTLGSNIESHFYAIKNFRRKHEFLTIIDSDNLVESEFLNEFNKFFVEGYVAVQGVRKAKNLDTTYACIDEAGDMYYRYIDRKLLFDAGSSASLAGSGMAFTTDLYVQCLENNRVVGAGFDKVLQIEILKKDKRIAFVERAIVYDEKTSKSDQLVNQRARWINTWFKYAHKGLGIFLDGIWSMNFNKVASGIVFSRPPLFMLGIIIALSIILDVIFYPNMLFFWVFCITCFTITFFNSLMYFKAPKAIYSALASIPSFFYFQILSLFKAKGANSRSVATIHYHKDIENSKSNKS